MSAARVARLVERMREGGLSFAEHTAATEIRRLLHEPDEQLLRAEVDDVLTALVLIRDERTAAAAA